MTKEILIISSIYTFLAFPPISFSTSVQYDTQGTIWQTDSIVNVGTDGNDMAGMTRKKKQK